MVSDRYFITGRKVISDKELAAMVSSSMADIPSDAEISDIDDAEVEVHSVSTKLQKFALIKKYLYNSG